MLEAYNDSGRKRANWKVMLEIGKHLKVCFHVT